MMTSGANERKLSLSVTIRVDNTSASAGPPPNTPATASLEHTIQCPIPQFRVFKPREFIPNTSPRGGGVLLPDEQLILSAPPNTPCRPVMLEDVDEAALLLWAVELMAGVDRRGPAGVQFKDNTQDALEYGSCGVQPTSS